MALSATLAVFGEGLRTPRPRRIRPRVGLVGAAVVCATLLGGAFKLRSGQAHEASLLAAPRTLAAAEPVAAAPLPKPSSTAHAPSVPHVSTVLKRPAKSGHDSWNRKSFGGRL